MAKRERRERADWFVFLFAEEWEKIFRNLLSDRERAEKKSRDRRADFSPAAHFKRSRRNTRRTADKRFGPRKCDPKRHGEQERPD
jgi:hypothetical protein